MKLTQKKILMVLILTLAIFSLIGGIMLVMPSWFSPLLSMNFFGFTWGMFSMLAGVAIILVSIMFIAKCLGDQK